MTVNWQTWEPNVRATLMFIRDKDRILLIRKKRGIGAGKINGPGGKLDPGETVLECAVRETQEELHVTALEPVEMGTLSFAFVDGMHMHVTVFLAEGYEGTPTETDEAIPIWTPVDAIPFEEMWADDACWLNEMLAGQKFTGTFVFDGDKMLERDVRFLP